MLGVAEIPLEIIREKMKVSTPSDLQVHEWQPPLVTCQHLWTDGSVQLAQYPWLTMASFAVVAEDTSLISSGRVWHWRLSSYSAELWAILVAFSTAAQPIVVHTDSLTIVKQFAELQRLDKVQLEWTHSQWWGFLLALIHLGLSLIHPCNWFGARHIC